MTDLGDHWSAEGVVRQAYELYLKFIEKPLWISVSVSVSTEWTPGDNARKSILTD